MSREPRARETAGVEATLFVVDVLIGEREIGAGGANTSDFAVQMNGEEVHSSVKLNWRP